MPLGWYAASTRHQHEKSAAQILENKEFEVLLPLYSVAHRWKDRVQNVSLPVFPCYLFVRARLERRLQILQTPGICQLVTFAGLPAAIPDHEIAVLQAAVRSSAKMQPQPYLSSGDRVYVKRGPLTGVEGILVRHKNQFRIVLSVELLRQSVAVEVDIAVVERVSPFRAGAGLALGQTKCPA